jgi:hypothetical protein
MCFLAAVIYSISLPEKANSWTTEGRWSTLKFNCLGNIVKIGVDMNSRIGGGDASPIRKAYINSNGNMSQATWHVGASMNSIKETGEGGLKLTLGNNGTFLESEFAPPRKCKQIN